MDSERETGRKKVLINENVRIRKDTEEFPFTLKDNQQAL